MRDGPLNIASLDPGGSTGWAKYYANVIMTPDGKPEFYDELFTKGVFRIEDGLHHKKLYDTLGHWQVHNFIIVCESFEFRREQRDNVELISREYIGVVNFFQQERMNGFPHNELVYQTAATGKGFWYPKKPGTQQRDASKLKALNLYTPGATHTNDAMAHLLHYMAFTMGRKDLFERLK